MLSSIKMKYSKLFSRPHYEIHSQLHIKLSVSNDKGLYGWTNCAFGLYPSSGVSKTNKIEELKI
jgi:hypothetical protein